MIDILIIINAIMFGFNFRGIFTKGESSKNVVEAVVETVANIENPFSKEYKQKKEQEELFSKSLSNLERFDGTSVGQKNI